MHKYQEHQGSQRGENIFQILNPDPFTFSFWADLCSSNRDTAQCKCGLMATQDRVSLYVLRAGLKCRVVPAKASSAGIKSRGHHTQQKEAQGPPRAL